MRDYEKLQVIWRVLLVSLLVVGLICHAPRAQGQEELAFDDVKAVIRTVIPALEALEAQLPATGRGAATMKTEKYLDSFEGKELTVDFVFKNQNSRMDTFEWVGGTKASRLRVRAESEKCAILADDENATVNPAKAHSSLRNDFHPETFVRFLGYPLTKLLRNTLAYDFAANPKHYASADLDHKGILHIVSGGPVPRARGEQYDYERQMSFDTKKALVPILLRSTNKRPEGTSSTMIRLEWAQYDSVWYVSSVEYWIEPGKEHYRVFRVKNFSPNVDVSDEEFTLAGLGLPDGVRVFDRLAGVSYYYGAPNSLIDDLEKPLEEAEFVQKIHEQQPTLVSQVSATSAREEPVDRNQASADPGDSARTTAVHADARSAWPKRIVIACAVLLVAVVGLAGYRRAATRS